MLQDHLCGESERERETHTHTEREKRNRERREKKHCMKGNVVLVAKSDKENKPGEVVAKKEYIRACSFHSLTPK